MLFYLLYLMWPPPHLLNAVGVWRHESPALKTPSSRLPRQQAVRQVTSQVPGNPPWNGRHTQPECVSLQSHSAQHRGGRLASPLLFDCLE